MLKVEEIQEDVEVDADRDDISEPDEDSLAGQMALMKGGKVKASPVHANGTQDEDGDSSEGEYETSSDEEGPRKGRAINEDSDSDSD